MSDKKYIECTSCFGDGEHENPDEEEVMGNPSLAYTVCYLCFGNKKIEVTDDMITLEIPFYKVNEHGETVFEYCSDTGEDEPIRAGYETQLATYVGVYVETRHYGGPEEGGWWYNNQEHEFSIPLATRGDRADYDKVVAFLKERYEGQGDIYSVRGGYKYQFRAEYTKGQFQNTARPYYC